MRRDEFRMFRSFRFAFLGRHLSAVVGMASGPGALRGFRRFMRLFNSERAMGLRGCGG